MIPVVWPDPRLSPEASGEPSHLDLDAAYADYEAVRGEWAPRDRASVIRDTQRAAAALKVAWQTGDMGDLPGLARELAIDAPRDASLRHSSCSAEPIDPHVLARLGADLSPALGLYAPDRLLGPWATLLELPRDGRLLQIVMAAGALMLTDELPFTPRRMWIRRKPLPRRALRERVRAVAHAAYTAYPALRVQDGWAELGPGVGTDAPVGRVDVRGVAALPGERGLQEGDTLACRIVQAARGPVACLGIAIPGPVPSAAEAWLDLLLLEHRLVDRRAGPWDALRQRGHVLVRRVAEAAWIR